MDLHLFSSPGERDDLRYIIEAAGPHLAGKPDATVAYLPMASLYGERFLESTQKSFGGLGRVELLDAERMELPAMEAILRRAHVAYIPGGNTYLLNHRLHVSRLKPYLVRKIRAGLPLVAFSAGTVLCGPNILTSNDLNAVETPYFEGLNVTPFNFNVHYAGELERDNWLVEYQVFHDNPVILMADASYVKVTGRKTQLVTGEAWILRKGREKERIKPGESLTV